MFGKRPLTFFVSLLSVFVLLLSLSTFVSAKPRKKSKKRKETAEQRIARENREAALRQAILLGVSASQANSLNGSTATNSGRDLSVSPPGTGSLASFAPDPEARAPGIQPNTATAGQFLISEFREQGPNGINDEFIEIYNNSGADHTVAAAVTDG